MYIFRYIFVLKKTDHKYKSIISHTAQTPPLHATVRTRKNKIFD